MNLIGKDEMGSMIEELKLGIKGAKKVRGILRETLIENYNDETFNKILEIDRMIKKSEELIELNMSEID